MKKYAKKNGNRAGANHRVGIFWGHGDEEGSIFWEEENIEMAKWIIEKFVGGETICVEDLWNLRDMDCFLFEKITYPIGKKCDFCSNYFNVDEIEFDMKEYNRTVMKAERMKESSYASGYEKFKNQDTCPDVVRLKIDWPLRGYIVGYRFIIDERWLNDFKHRLTGKINRGDIKNLPKPKEWEIIREILGGEFILEGFLCENCYVPEFSKGIPFRFYNLSKQRTGLEKYRQAFDLLSCEIEKVVVIK
jgi:hypothetical protein